jgi:threonylcarbamoyladenosine tRNA methylthiotransferase MtaB
MTANRTFHILSLGCKANQYDSAAMADGLVRHGYSPAPRGEAGMVVIHACAVTSAAAGQARRELRRARRDNPGALVALSGCLARTPHLAEGSGADLVLDDPSGWPDDPAFSSARRARPLLKVQDGCSRSCAYCIVPAARGAPRSLAPARVLAALRSLMGRGAGEVALTGVHLGLYGSDLLPRTSLEDLLAGILDAGLPGRVRLSSLEAGEVSGRLLGLMSAARGRICPHLHLSLQSGSERVLAAMGREGRAADFPAVVARARAVLPGAGIGCDLIAGFPGERAEDFARTLALVEESGIPFVHVFPFSPRPGTGAAAMSGQVPPALRRERVRRLIAAGAENRGRFLSLFPGETLEVVFEGPQRRPAGRWTARAGNHLAVSVEGGARYVRGAAARALITGVGAGVLLGEVE